MSEYNDKLPLITLAKILTWEGGKFDFDRSGLVPEHFPEGDVRDAYLFIKTHQTEHGNVPPRAKFKGAFPNLSLIDPKSYNTEQIISDMIHVGNVDIQISSIRKGLTEALAIRDKDPQAASRVLSENMAGALAKTSNTFKTHDVTLDDSYLDKFRHTLATRRSGKEGYTYPWKFMDKVKINKGELHCIAARPKRGKTFFIIKVGLHLWNFCNVLLISNEITTTRILDRAIAMRLGIPYNDVLTGNIEDQTPVFEDKFINSLKSDYKFHISGSEGGINFGTLQGVASKIDQYNPDVVLIDGAYLLQSEKNSGSEDHQRYRAIVRGLKNLSVKKQLPIIVTWQFNRSASQGKKGGSENLGYTDALGQDSDLVIGITATEDQEKAGVVTLSTIVARDAAPFEGRVYMNFATMNFDAVDEAPESIEDLNQIGLLTLNDNDGPF